MPDSRHYVRGKDRRSKQIYKLNSMRLINRWYRSTWRIHAVLSNPSRARQLFTSQRVDLEDYVCTDPVKKHHSMVHICRSEA